MIHVTPMSRQPHHEAWTLECLNAELTINFGLAIDRSTHDCYSSAPNSYLTFCRIHNFNIEPTLCTLTLFVMFQSVLINLKSVVPFWDSQPAGGPLPQCAGCLKEHPHNLCSAGCETLLWHPHVLQTPPHSFQPDCHIGSCQAFAST
jgi:hypothetical protein